MTRSVGRPLSLKCCCRHLVARMMGLAVKVRRAIQRSPPSSRPSKRRCWGTRRDSSGLQHLTEVPSTTSAGRHVARFPAARHERMRGWPQPLEVRRRFARLAKQCVAIRCQSSCHATAWSRRPASAVSRATRPLTANASHSRCSCSRWSARRRSGHGGRKAPRRCADSSRGAGRRTALFSPPPARNRACAAPQATPRTLS